MIRQNVLKIFVFAFTLLCLNAQAGHPPIGLGHPPIELGHPPIEFGHPPIGLG